MHVLAMIGSKVIARFTAEGHVEAVPLPFFYNCILLSTCMPAWKINVQVVNFLHDSRSTVPVWYVYFKINLPVPVVHVPVVS